MDANLDVTMILLASLQVMGLVSAFKLTTQGNVTESRGKAQSCMGLSTDLAFLFWGVCCYISVDLPPCCLGARGVSVVP